MTYPTMYDPNPADWTQTIGPTGTPSFRTQEEYQAWFNQHMLDDLDRARLRILSGQGTQQDVAAFGAPVPGVTYPMTQGITEQQRLNIVTSPNLM